MVWSADLAELSPGAVSELGALTLEHTPLVSGVARRADGSLLGRTSIDLSLRPESGLPEAEVMPWYFLIRSLSLRTDEQGRFRLDGPDRLAQLALLEVPDSHPQVQRQGFAAGETGVLLQPDAATEVHGWVKLGAGIRAEDVVGRLEHDRGSIGVFLQDDGSFRQRIQPDKDYRLRIIAIQSGESLHVVEGVRVFCRASPGCRSDRPRRSPIGVHVGRSRR